MTPQSGQQAITIHILPSTSRSENNQAMKFGLVIENNKTNFLYKNYAEKEPEKLVPDLFLSFKKTLYEVKANGLQLSFDIFQ